MCFFSLCLSLSDGCCWQLERHKLAHILSEPCQWWKRKVVRHPKWFFVLSLLFLPLARSLSSYPVVKFFPSPRRMRSSTFLSKFFLIYVEHSALSIQSFFAVCLLICSLLFSLVELVYSFSFHANRYRNVSRKYIALHLNVHNKKFCIFF